MISLFGSKSFEAKRDYPVLFGKHLDTAAAQAKEWGEKRLRNVIKLLTLSDLSLRKHNSHFQVFILYNCFYQIMEL